MIPPSEQRRQGRRVDMIAMPMKASTSVVAERALLISRFPQLVVGAGGPCSRAGPPRGVGAEVHDPAAASAQWSRPLARRIGSERPGTAAVTWGDPLGNQVLQRPRTPLLLGQQKRHLRAQEQE